MVNTNNNIFSLSSREAAEDAGFNVLRVISQPAAAALAYGNLHWPFSDMCCEGARIGCWFVSFVMHVQYSSLESRNLDCEQSLFGQSRPKLGRTGESELTERGTGERREEEGPSLLSRLLPSSPWFKLASHSRFHRSREFALSSPAELTRD